jgi:hypothetical protein
MPNQEAFSRVPPDLMAVFAEIQCREPIFHTTRFGTTLSDFDQILDPGYWEVGASGRRYSREFILRTLSQYPPVNAASAGWHTYDYGIRRLGTDAYLFTYTLRQNDRVTRRATIWQTTPGGWRILYHQGTMVASEEDDVVPRRSA